MPVVHSKKVIFYHIPKTAGTSIESMLGLTYSKRLIHETLLNHVNTPSLPAYQHFTPSEVSEVLRDQGKNDVCANYYKFTIVRNPYDRAISTYKFMCSTGMLKDIVKKMGQFKNGIKSFNDFLCVANHYVKSNVEHVERYNKIPFMHHLRPQSHWFIDENNVYDDVFQFENLEECRTKLKPYFDLSKQDNPLPLLNQSSKDYKSIEQKMRLYDKNALYLFESTYGSDFDLGPVHYPTDLIVNT